MAHSRKYAAAGNTTVSSQATMLGLSGASTIELSIFYIGIGSNASPADVTLEWYMNRSTAAGTGTSVTPQNLGPGTTASITTCLRTITTPEPTYTANAVLWRLALNQRAAHSLVFDADGCPTAPAVNNNGIGLYVSHASAVPTVVGCLYFRE